MFTHGVGRVWRCAVVWTGWVCSVCCVTRYLEIADRLAAELGDLVPGSRVASESELARRFGVGRAAARAALQELERRLLVRRVRGAGTFVIFRIDYLTSRDGPASWRASALAAGATPRSMVRRVDRVELPESEATWFAREPGSAAYRVVREFYADDVLASWSEEWVPADLVPELDVALRVVDSVGDVLRQVGGLQSVRTWYRVALETPPPLVLRELNVEPSCPVYRWENHSRDRVSGRPLRRTTAWTRADVVRVIVELTGTISEDDASHRSRSLVRGGRPGAGVPQDSKEEG